MTSSGTPSQQPVTDSDETEKDDERGKKRFPPAVDGVLQQLVYLVNRRGLNNGPPITLVLDGRIVTGYVMSMAAFYRERGEELASLASDPAAKAQIRANSEESAERSLSRAQQGVLPNFFHLRNARYLSGNELVPKNGLRIRGKLSRVSAWSEGSLTTEGESG